MINIQTCVGNERVLKVVELNAHHLNENESYERGIFGYKSNPEARFVSSYEQLEQYVEACRTFGLKVVLTSGSFDMLHVGHARYLEKAKEYGDMLIVGIDSDAKVKKRKGESRPVVPEDERVQMLAHMRSVDLITLKHPEEKQWELIRRLRPDTLIVTQETYTNETIQELEEICGRVIVLEPQAITSTSAQLRKLQIGWTEKIIDPVDNLLESAQVSEDLRRSIARVLLGKGQDD